MSRWQLIWLVIKVLCRLLFKRDISSVLDIFAPKVEPEAPAAPKTASNMVYDVVKSRLVHGGRILPLLLLMAGLAYAGGSFTAYDGLTKLNKRITGGVGIDISAGGVLTATGSAVVEGSIPYSNISSAGNSAYLGKSQPANSANAYKGNSVPSATEFSRLAGVTAPIQGQISSVKFTAESKPDLSNVVPTMNGIGAAGTGPTAARVDHVHASDTSREPANANIQTHISSTANPHSVTKSQVGLGNVDNTSDANKPVSTATQTALNLKANTAALGTVAFTNSYTSLSDKPATYTLPTASTTVKGGIKVDGTTIVMDGNGVASATVSAGVTDVNGQTGTVTVTPANIGAATLTVFTNYTTGAAPRLAKADTALQPGLSSLAVVSAAPAASGETNDAIKGTITYTSTAPAWSSYVGSAGHFRATFNNGSGLGTIHGLSSHASITAGGDDRNELTALFLDTNSDDSGRIWGTDQNVMGPVNNQADLILGQSILVNNYNSATITNGGWGPVITTWPGAGGGDKASDRTVRRTYPLDAGLAIVGASGTPAAKTGVGFTSAIQLGGHAGGWMGLTDASVLGTGIKFLSTFQGDGIDLSGAAISGSAIKLASTQTITDGTVTKTLAQLATPPTNITGNAGTASALSAVSALPNGTTATTQTAGDNSTKVATTAYVNAAVSASGGGNVTGPGSSTTGHIAVFAGTDGKTLADGGAAGTGTITGVTAGTGLTGGGTSGGVTVGMANRGAYSLMGNNTGSSAAPADLSISQVMAMLGAQPALSGVNSFEFGDGTGTVYQDWHTSPGVDFNLRVAKSAGLNSQFTFNNRGISGTETGSVVFDSTNSVLTGHTQIVGNLTIGSQDVAQAHAHIISEDTTPSLFIDSYNNTTQPSIIGRRAGGSKSSPAQVGADYTLFNFAARPWFSDTAAWSTAGYASFTIKAAEAMDSTHHGTYMQFLTTAKGNNSNTERARIYDDGGFQLGGTFGTSPGAGNLSVLNMIVSGYEEKTASYTVSKDSSKITLASSTAVVTLPKTLPAGEVSVLVTVAGAAASGVSFAAESGGSLSWGDIGAPTFTNSKTSDVVCLSQNAAATTTATWRCTKGGDF